MKVNQNTPLHMLFRHMQMKKLQEEILLLLSEEKNIEYGVTAAPVNGLIARLLGQGAEHLFGLLNKINATVGSKYKSIPSGMLHQ